MIMKTLSSTARTALVLSAGILAIGPVQAAQTAYQAQMAKDQQAHPTLAIGSQAPAFDLLGIDGRRHTLDEYHSPILAVVFISNHCPASQLYEGRIKAIARDYQDQGVQVVAIAPNGPDVIGPAALNYTDVDDSFESMKVRAEFREFNFPYLYDGETQAVAHQYGPKVTPHIFIFDAERKLRYEGRIDDRMQEAKSKVSDARNALDAMLAQKPVAVAHTAVFGCSTKWNEHLESAQAEMKEWNARPVSVETISLDGLRQLRASAPGKTLMINFWATWCAPCQTEYPALLETYLWYRSRDFEFVSVAMQEPAEQPAVLKFLQKQHSAVRNLMLDSDDVYAAMAAFDPAWESGVPFTIVIAADGKVLLRQQGEVNKLELRRKILGNLPDAGMFAGNTEYWNN